MNFRYISLVRYAPLTIAAALSAATAYSQSDIATAVQAKLKAGVAKMETSCGEDIKKFCSTVTPGEGRAILCLEAHEDKLSPKCTFEMIEAAKNLKTAMDTLSEATGACRTDIGKFCAQTKPGQGRLVQCLMTNKASISTNCANAVQKLNGLAAK